MSTSTTSNIVFLNGEIPSDLRLEYLKDIWDCRKFGVKTSPANPRYRLVFTDISQDWLKTSTKEYCKTHLAQASLGSILQKIYAIKKLSLFLTNNYSRIEAPDITRKVIIEFTIYLKSKGLAANTRCQIIGNIRSFFDLALHFQWLAIKQNLILDQDFPKREKKLPRYIPEEVLTQLNLHIRNLPESIARMALILQEVGMRISELCQLNYDCLLQDNSGDWSLKYFQFKMKKEVTIPISPKTASIILKQQNYIRQYLPKEFNYLFCGSNNKFGQTFIPFAKIPDTKILNRYLNALAKKYNIRDNLGILWNFQSHQFRHTVATRMINKGVPQHIIQKYLGHESPSMTATYATIHDQTMKGEIQNFYAKTKGKPEQACQLDNQQQWFQNNDQALPHGFCALPTRFNNCQTTNFDDCLICANFKTSIKYLGYHKQRLEQIERETEKAQQNNWTQQVKIGKRQQTNLKNIIKKIEDSANATWV